MKTARTCVAAALMAALLTGCGAPAKGAASAAETSGAAAAVLDVRYQSDNPSSEFNSKMEQAASQYEQAHAGVKLTLHSLDSATYK